MSDILISWRKHASIFVQYISCLLKEMENIYWSEDCQSTSTRPSLNTNTIPQEVLTTFLTHDSSNSNLDICYHSNSTNADENLPKKKNKMCK